MLIARQVAGGYQTLTALEETIHLLHVLGYLYGRHGQVTKEAAFLLLAAQHVGVLCTLFHLLIVDNEADKALATIVKLETLERMKHPTLGPLKGRALPAAGRTDDARKAFQEFLAQRKDMPQCRIA